MLGSLCNASAKMQYITPWARLAGRTQGSQHNTLLSTAGKPTKKDANIFVFIISSLTSNGWAACGKLDFLSIFSFQFKYKVCD